MSDETTVLGCNYQGHEFGANYLDSVCLEGYLWDADSGDPDPGGDGWNYTVGGDIPCPQCNHVEWLEAARDQVEQLGWIAADAGEPESTCVYDTCDLHYRDDRETLKTWWRKGYAERLTKGNDDEQKES